VALATFNLIREYFDVFGAFPIVSAFEETAIDAVWDDVAHRVYGEAAATQVAFVVLTIVDVAGETRVTPDDQAGDVRPTALAAVG